MFVRISTYAVPEGRSGEAITAFGDAIASIEEMPGLVSAHLLLNENGDEAMTLTYWESHDAMAASRVHASRVRTEAAEAIGTSVRASVEYQVAVSSAATTA